MDGEPETLSLWSKMVATLKSHIIYGPCVKQIVSDINVTDIFINREGGRDEDAITFWSQLIATNGVKTEVETMLSHSLKRGKDRGIMVQRIPLSRNTEIAKEFIAYVTTKIRNTPSLWNVGTVNFMKSKAPKISEIEHRHSGCIITSQFKAWNDTVRMAMYIDLILKPLAESQGGKFYLWII